MSHRQPLCATLATQLCASLDAYQAKMDRLENPSVERDAYRDVGRQLDEIRAIKVSLPRVSVAMVEVLISHVELIEGLWTCATPFASGELVQSALRERHATAVARMKERCISEYG